MDGLDSWVDGFMDSSKGYRRISSRTKISNCPKWASGMIPQQQSTDYDTPFSAHGNLLQLQPRQLSRLFPDLTRQLRHSSPTPRLSIYRVPTFIFAPAPVTGGRGWEWAWPIALPGGPVMGCCEAEGSKPCVSVGVSVCLSVYLAAWSIASRGAGDETRLQGTRTNPTSLFSHPPPTNPVTATTTTKSQVASMSLSDRTRPNRNSASPAQPAGVLSLGSITLSRCLPFRSPPPSLPASGSRSPNHPRRQGSPRRCHPVFLLLLPCAPQDKHAFPPRDSTASCPSVFHVSPGWHWMGWGGKALLKVVPVVVNTW